MKMLMRILARWGPQAVLVGHEDDHNNRFNIFLGTMLRSDCHSIRSCSYLIQSLNDVAQSPDENAEQEMNGNAWIVTIRKKGVHILFSIDDDKHDTFPLDQVLRAAKGWLKLLKMPQSPESQVIVEL